MKRIIGTAAGLCLLAASQAFAQQTPETKSVETGTTLRTLPGATLETERGSVSGTVTEFRAGKTITLSGSGDKSHTFDLRGSARVDGTVVVGQTATVEFTRGTDGKETVVVVSVAVVSPVGAPEASTMQSDSVKMSDRAAADTKTETVVGTVKEYEAGKSIKVTGPGNKDYSFDLNDTAVPKKAVRVGERVQVTFTKSDNGDKVTTIVAYPTKA